MEYHQPHPLWEPGDAKPITTNGESRPSYVDLPLECVNANLLAEKNPDRAVGLKRGGKEEECGINGLETAGSMSQLFLSFKLPGLITTRSKHFFLVLSTSWFPSRFSSRPSRPRLPPARLRPSSAVSSPEPAPTTVSSTRTGLTVEARSTTTTALLARTASRGTT